MTFRLEDKGYRVTDKECPRAGYCPSGIFEVMWNNLELDPYDAAECAQCGEPLEVASFDRCLAVLDHLGTYQCTKELNHSGPHNAGWAKGNHFKEKQEGWIER